MIKIKHRITVLFLLLLPLFFFPSMAEAESTILKQYSLALQKEAEGDFLSAIFIYQDVLKQNKYFLDAKIGLARCYLETGNLTLSEETLLDALKQKKENVTVFNLLGRVYTSMKRYKEAEDLFRRSIEIEPARYETKYRLADLFRAEGSFESAIKLYNDILKVYPRDTRTYIYLGIVYTEIGELEKAGGFYRKAVSLDSQDSLTHNNLARHYYRMGIKYSVTDTRASAEYFDAARYEAHTALAIQNKLPEVHELLASVYFFKKDYAAAVKEYEKLLHFHRNSFLILYELGFCQEMLGNQQSAVDYYSKALLKRIDDEIVRFRLENLLLDLYREKLSQPERVQLSDYHLSKGRFYLDRNIMNKAFLQYKRSVMLHPINPEKRLELAELLKARGFTEQYLFELKNILHETLDIDTVDINDKIEIYSSRIRNNLGSRWGVKQYSEDEESPVSFPETKTRIAVLDAFRSDYIREDFLHRRLSLTFKEMLSLALSYSPKIEIVDDLPPQESRTHSLPGDEEVSMQGSRSLDEEISMPGNSTGRKPLDEELCTPADALRKAQSLGVDYYITGLIEESSDSLKVHAFLISGFNGKIKEEFTTYYTGNDRVFNTVVSLAEDISARIPLRGLIVRIEGGRALINLGSAHGVEKDSVFHILQEGGLRTNPETGEFEVDPEITLGELTITETDEMVSEGEYTYKGTYNRVNVYDNVVFAGMKKEEEKKE